jgi:hypothetical protein
MIAGHSFHVGREDTAPATTTKRHRQMRLPDVDLVMKDIIIMHY